MKDRLAISNLNPINDPLVNLGKFGFAVIEDVAAAAIVGGASATVDANASAYGSHAKTYTQANTLAAGTKPFAVAFGEGMAVAIGDRASASVNPSGTGDKVKTISQKIDLPGESVAIGAVVAFG